MTTLVDKVRRYLGLAETDEDFLRSSGAGARTTSEGPSEAGLTLDACCNILSSARRRDVIGVLADGPASLQELATRIARKETGEDDPEWNARRRVWVSLYQTHLPKLADHGVIGPDWTTQDDQPVRPGPAFDVVFESLTCLVRRLPDPEPAWTGP